MVSLTNQARLLAAQEFNRRVIAQKLASGKNVSRARFGVLTGRVATVDPRTKRVTAISTTKSRTALETEKRLRDEITRQRVRASRETDIERFLKNERSLASGRLSSKQIRAQIAARKRRGLSKTPAQRAALARVVQEESRTALSARARRKGSRGVRRSLISTPAETLGLRRAEEARAFGLGSSPFSDPSFQFGGRSRAEVIKRGGVAGRRAAGESFSDTLGFVRSARLGASRERISFAQGLLGGFGGRSTSDLLSIVGSQRRSTDPLKAERGALTQIPLAPATFEQRLRSGEGFFTEEAIPFTEKQAPPKSRRQTAVRARKIQDLAKAARARSDIARQGSIERISVLGSQVIEGRRIPSIGVDPIARREAAQATQRETNLLRSLSFGEPIPVRATGVATRTPQAFAPTGRQFSVSLRDTIGVSDRLATARKRLSNAKARGKAATTKTGKAKAQQSVKKQQKSIADITREIREGIKTRTVGAATGALTGVARAGADVFGDLFNFEGGDTLGNLFSGTIVPATGQTEAINIFDVGKDVRQTFQLGN